MKKNFMKFAVVLLSCMMVFVMTACGGSGDSGESGDGGETAAATGTLHLGGIGPLTGPAAIYGIAVKQGAQVAVDEINAANPDGLQLAWDMQDDEHDAEKSVNAYNKLLDSGMQVLVGTVTSAPCTAVAAEAMTNRTFALTPSASSTAVTEGNDNVFQLCFADPNQGISAADYIVENYSDAVVGVIYNNADNYSTGIYDKFKAEFESKGGTIVATEAFQSDDNADFSAQLGSMQKAGATMVFMPIYYTPASNIMTQAASMGYSPTFFGCDGMDGILGMEGFDTTNAEGLLFITPFIPTSDDESVQSFVSAYEAAYGETPNQFAADAYDCVYAVYDAFQKTGLSADASMEEICEAMIGVFTSSDFSFSGLTGSGMQWAASGEVTKIPRICVVENGEYAEK
jgi:branched-chain amino acid transport system substrate-binding protein